MSRALFLNLSLFGVAWVIAATLAKHYEYRPRLCFAQPTTLATMPTAAAATGAAGAAFQPPHRLPFAIATRHAPLTTHRRAVVPPPTPLRRRRDRGHRPPPPTAAANRVCRRCRRTYDPATNGPTACSYHPRPYTGDSVRKGDWGAAVGGAPPPRGTAFFWWCCGEADVDHPGCKTGPHIGYEE